jgi:hypothetical protein
MDRQVFTGGFGAFFIGEWFGINDSKVLEYSVWEVIICS